MSVATPVATPDATSHSSRTDVARDLFDTRHRFSKGIVERGVSSFGPAWEAELESTLAHLYPDDADLALAVDGYAAFAMDSMRRQARFERDLAYPAKTYAEAADEVYFDADYMQRQYLPGLLLSHYLWPHHYRQIQFFDTAFVGPLGAAGGATFSEVGIGTGLYSRRLLSALPGLIGTGYDISPASKRFSEHHLSAYGFSGRYEVVLQDVVSQPMRPTDWLVCVEVLEHLEDPAAFLRSLRGALRPGGRAFITAALNAANADHIYLYRTPAEVWQQLDDAGFTLVQSFHGAAYAPPRAGSVVPSAAAFVVA